MKRSLKTAVCLVFSFTVVFACTSCQPKKTASSQTTQTAETTVYTPPSIDETKDSFVKEGYNDFADKVRSCLQPFYGTVLIAYKGDIIYSEGFGNADQSKNTKNTMNTTFEIASMTKQFTAAAVLKLRDEGKVSVVSPIGQYFPNYKNGGKITIKNLLQMRSGIADYADEPEQFFKDQTVVEALKQKLLNHEKIDENYIVDHLNDSDLEFEPDSRYQYCNTNYYLLSLIVEQVSGLSFESYIDTNFFQPLGLSRSTFGSAASEAKGSGGADAYDVVMDMAKGDGCIVTNVTDFYKWEYALFHGQVVSQKSFAEMTTFQDNYGCGLMSLGKYIGHGGSFPGFTSYGVNEPSKELTILLFSNAVEMKDGKSINYYLGAVEKICENEISFIK